MKKLNPLQFFCVQIFYGNIMHTEGIYALIPTCMLHVEYYVP